MMDLVDVFVQKTMMKQTMAIVEPNIVQDDADEDIPENDIERGKYSNIGVIFVPVPAQYTGRNTKDDLLKEY